MKNDLFSKKICVFALVLQIFVIPSLTTSYNPDFSSIFRFFPFIPVVFFVFAMLLFMYIRDDILKKEVNGNKILKRVLNFGYATFCFGSLFIIVSLLSAFLLVSDFKIKNNNANISLPAGILQWMFLLINFFSLAFFEEIIFRAYIPDFPILIEDKINKPKEDKKITLAYEIIALILFAMGHRYLGWAAVINAACGHCVLRNCYKKTNSVITCSSVHFLYNLLNFIIIVYL